MLVHEKTEHVHPATLWHGIVLLFIGMYECPQGIQEGIQWVLFVGPYLVQQAVEAFYSEVIFVFVTNR
jgi:hypothetical protein